MDTILFNFHDVLMIVTAFECLLFALLLFVTNKEKSVSTYLFIAFLLCHLLITLHELTFWGKQFRIWLLDISPNLFFSGSYAYFLDGPILYIFVRALIYKDFSFKKTQAIHLLPVTFYFLQMLFVFYLQDSARQTQLIESQHIAYSAPYLYFEAVGRYLRFAYAIACLALVYNYRTQLKLEYAHLNHGDINWLKVMLVGFICLFFWDTVLLTIKLYSLLVGHFNLDLLNVVGLSSYYLNFTVLNGLIFLKFTSLTTVAKINKELVNDTRENRLDDEDKATAKLLVELMEEKKLYTDPNITVDKLAEAANLTPKMLSQTIKYSLHLNFYEFVNRYRISEAKRLLSEQGSANKSIAEIYHLVGFNSKSVFNTYFKRVEGITPSQYRDKFTITSEV